MGTGVGVGVEELPLFNVGPPQLESGGRNRVDLVVDTSSRFSWKL